MLSVISILLNLLSLQGGCQMFNVLQKAHDSPSVCMLCSHYSKHCVNFHIIQLSASVLEVPLRMM
jgi:hypothetical protein